MLQGLGLDCGFRRLQPAKRGTARISFKCTPPVKGKNVTSACHDEDDSCYVVVAFMPRLSPLALLSSSAQHGMLYHCRSGHHQHQSVQYSSKCAGHTQPRVDTELVATKSNQKTDRHDDIRCPDCNLLVLRTRGC